MPAARRCCRSPCRPAGSRTAGVGALPRSIVLGITSSGQQEEDLTGRIRHLRIRTLRQETWFLARAFRRSRRSGEPHRCANPGAPRRDHRADAAVYRDSDPVEPRHPQGAGGPSPPRPHPLTDRLARRSELPLTPSDAIHFDGAATACGPRPQPSCIAGVLPASHIPSVLNSSHCRAPVTAATAPIGRADRVVVGGDSTQVLPARPGTPALRSYRRDITPVAPGHCHDPQWLCKQ